MCFDVVLVRERSLLANRCSHEEFATIIDLPEGVHQYKFIVDDEWRYNPDLPTMPDRYGWRWESWLGPNRARNF